MFRSSISLAFALLLLTGAFATLDAQTVPTASPVELHIAQITPAEGLIAVDCGGTTLFLQPQAELTGDDIAQASIVDDPNIQAPAIELVFTPEGSVRMEVSSQRNMGKLLALLLNGELATAPAIHAPLREKVLLELPKTPIEDLEKIVAGLNQNTPKSVNGERQRAQHQRFPELPR